MEQKITPFLWFDGNAEQPKAKNESRYGDAGALKEV
jgi:predicted 3-demethylubiquinone-9 3-methyltransferase (glyoxalase superfamily)